MRTARLVGITVLVCVIGLTAGSASMGSTSRVKARDPACASLGVPADFVAFTDDQFNSSKSSGTSVTGRIAAATDVTLDGVFVGPATGDSTPTVIAGGNFTGGRTTGAGGTVNGGVQYGGSIDVAPNFTVNGDRTHSAPPFDFDFEFETLRQQSSSWGELEQTVGATVRRRLLSNALQLTGTEPGLNVFEVSAADLTAAPGIVIDLTQPDATALINVTADTPLSIAPQYMNLSGSATPERVAWNLPNAPALDVTHGVAWKGLILAPDAIVTSDNRPQLSGEIIAKSMPISDWVLSHVPFTGCLPPPRGSPDVSSTASGPVRLGASQALISDTASLSGGARPTGTIRFELHAPGDEGCTGAPVFSSTSSVAGNGDYRSGDFSPQRAGTYRWRVEYSGDQNNDGAGPTACDVAKETVKVSRARPSLSSRVPAMQTRPDGEIYDTAFLAHGFAPSGKLSFTLYGPDDATCSGDPVFRSKVGVRGNGPHISGAATPSSVGEYRWRVSYSGDSNNQPVRKTACGAENENVTIEQARPAIDTTASGTTVLGGTITDTATLTAGARPTGTITFDVYGPNDRSCAGAPADSTTRAVSGNGDYTSDGFRPSAHGVFRWVATYSGDRDNEAAATHCGDSGESVIVARPPLARTKLGSVASPGRGAGAPVVDVATLSGGSDPTGTITFDVYGPDDRACTRPPAGSMTVAVSGNGRYRSRPAFRPPAAGAYQWVVSYSGDQHNRAAGPTGCDVSAESFRVSRARPIISTTASRGVVAGAAIHDIAHLDRGASPGGLIVFRLYGPHDLACSGHAAFVTPQRVIGNGDYASPTFNPQRAGIYRWTASYTGDRNNRATATRCAEKSETVLIRRVRPDLSTQASTLIQAVKSRRAVTTGLTIHDAATLSNGLQPTGAIRFGLHGPNDPGCSRKPVFTTATVVTGNGTYNSEPFTPTASGTYRWVVSYSGDANNTSTRPAGCGSHSERVRVLVRAEPQLTSSASEAVTIGGSVHDTAHLSAGFSPTGTITFRLYGSGDTRCTGAPLFRSTVRVAGNGDYVSGAFPPTMAGSYRWVAGYPGDARNRSAGPTSCSDSAELQVVRPRSTTPVTPDFSTTSSPGRLGAPLYDIAHLSNGSAPGGTITFELFGPGDQSCSAAPVFTATTPVTTNDDFRSAAFIPGKPGLYRWVATYSGDAHNIGIGPTACGDSAETVTVGATPDPTPDPGPQPAPIHPKNHSKPAHKTRPPPPAGLG